MCCQIRTSILCLAFILGFIEVTLWVVFYTWRVNIRRAIGYSVHVEEDLIGLSVIIGVDLIVDVLLICGANKDYSGRQKDLRRWGYMIPWIIMYGLNILGLFACSIYVFYSFTGSYKALGILPLLYACSLLMGHLAVLFFVIEQRSEAGDLSSPS